MYELRVINISTVGLCACGTCSRMIRPLWRTLAAVKKSLTGFYFRPTILVNIALLVDVIFFSQLFTCWTFHCVAEILKNANHGSRVVQVEAVQASENKSPEYKQERVGITVSARTPARCMWMDYTQCFLHAYSGG